MLLIILVALVSFIFFARGLADFIGSLSKREAQPYISDRPAEIYYPSKQKKKETVPPQASKAEVVKATTPPALTKTNIVEEIAPLEVSKAEIVEEVAPAPEAINETQVVLPRPPCVNEFRRPRRAVNFKDISNSKFNYAPERNRAKRVPIPEHDEEVYREAERLRLLKARRLAEERNQRYLAQKRYEEHSR
jgi:hypothetical protein